MRLGILLLLGLSGCALFPSVKNYEKRIATWHGSLGTELVAAWGVPERTINMPDGSRAYEYRKFDGGGNMCRTTFLTDAKEDRIHTVNYQGHCATY